MCWKSQKINNFSLTIKKVLIVTLFPLPYKRIGFGFEKFEFEKFNVKKILDKYLISIINYNIKQQ